MRTWTEKHIEDLLAKGKIKGYRIIGKQEQLITKKRLKYGNKKTVIDGRVFDSKKEAGRYLQLRMMQTAGLIKNLQCQVEYRLEVEGSKIAKYIADFCYEENGVEVVEDVKSSATRKLPTYRLKKKLMKAIFGIEIKEV